MSVADTPPQQPPGPDPALERLDRFVGTWEMKGRTLDSDVGNVTGRTTFEWLPGRFFLQQRIKLDFAGFEVEGLEVIGYDPATATFPSTVFPSMIGTPIPYRWEIEGDELKITTDVLWATFRGRWSEDGRPSRAGGDRTRAGKAPETSPTTSPVHEPERDGEGEVRRDRARDRRREPLHDARYRRRERVAVRRSVEARGSRRRCSACDCDGLVLLRPADARCGRFSG